MNRVRPVESLKPSSSYSAKDIVVLAGPEAIRTNPWMYVGAVDGSGAHQLLFELLHNAVDEALVGECSAISVLLERERCVVADDGRGIPTERHPTEGRSACEVVMTRLHSGSKFGRATATAGLHGVGLSSVNALSKFLKVEIRRGGGAFVQEFVRGKPTHPLKRVGSSKDRGTRIAFWPDSDIFESFVRFDAELCRQRLEELSFLVPGVEFALDDRLSSKQWRYLEKRGVEALLPLWIADEHALFKEPLRIEFSSEGMRFTAVLSWTASLGARFKSFVNCVPTAHGGTHVAAATAAITRAINDAMRGAGRLPREADALVAAEEATEGLRGVIDLRLMHPNFEGQTKAKLTNADVLDPIETAAYRQVSDALSRRSDVASVLFDRILETRRARLAARRAAERIYFQNAERGINEEVYKKQFAERSKDWHRSATWITHKELLRRHADMCRANPDAVLLDVCCGSGVVGGAFRRKVKKTIGLDLTPEMLAMAKDRLDEVRQGNVYNLPFHDNAFDVVCTREVLHLLPYPERPVSEIFRVLKPGGQFIVGQILPFGEADAPWMFRIFKKKQPLICNMFQEEDFRSLLHRGGFTDLEMTEMNVWESIDVWINSYETTPLHRHEIRDLFYGAPAEAKAVHPFKILPSGEIRDLWRWCVFSAKKPI